MEIRCPYCGSDQLYTDKKGYSLKKGIAGMVLTGGVGLLAGLFGSNKVIITCLSCGKKFNPGEGNVDALEQKIIESYTPMETEEYESINQEPEPICNMDDILLKEYKKDALAAEFDNDYEKAGDYWNMCLSEIFTNNIELDTHILERAINCYRKSNNVIREFFTYEDLITHFPNHPEVENWRKEKGIVETKLPKPPGY
jgi:DNA-directed RNA polymerase subunit RPC12/RpoP